MTSNHDESTQSNATSMTSNANNADYLESDQKLLKAQQSPASEINHGDPLNPSNSIQILLIRPSVVDSSIGLSNVPQPDQTIRINFLKTRVKDLKTYIFQNWQGKPKIDGIRLIARGRILNDSEVVGEALGKPPDDSSAHAIHVVVRPNAWTEKSPLTSRSVSAPPIATTDSSIPPSSSTLTSTPPALPNSSYTPPPAISISLKKPLSGNPSTSTDPTSTPASTGINSLTTSSAQIFINHFSSLTAYGKVNFIQNILQARFKIVERVDHLRRQIHDNHLVALGMTNAIKKTLLNAEQMTQHEQEWKPVEEKIVKLLTDLKAWNYCPEPIDAVDFDSNIELDTFDQSGSEFKRVEIGGLPYLLYIPEILSHQTSHTRSTKPTPDSHLRAYKTLHKQLNRTLHIEAQVDVLILQAQKIQAGLNQLDSIIYAGGINQTSNYAQRFQNMIHNIGGLDPPPGLAPFPPPAANAPAAGLGFGFGMGVDGLVPPNNFLLPNGPMWQHPVARVRRYEFTINLDSVRRYLAPLLWLSLKLSVLLYIFGRHASASKLVILIMIALGWVLWEAFSISQRHEAQARRRERLHRGQQVPGAAAADGGPAVDPIQAVLDRGRRRAERDRLQQILREQRQRVDGLLGVANQEPVAPANNAEPVVPAPVQPVEPPALNPVPRRNAGRGLRAAAAHIRARGGAFPPGTEVRPFRNTSALSPKYWFNSIAVVGLASEYRELGLHSIGERAMGASNIEYPRWYRYLRNTKTCLVLFFGTLLPEIEKKRRKALDKRARILNVVIADAARDVNNRPRNQDHQRVATTTGDDNNVGAMNPQPTDTPGPAVPRSSSEAFESSNSPAIKPGEDNDNQSTPRATKVTALERVPSASAHERSSFRRSRLVPELNEPRNPTNLTRRAPPERTPQLDEIDGSKAASVEEKPNSSSTLGTTQVENMILSETVTNGAPVPSTSHSVPNPSNSSGELQEQPQEAIINENVANLPSPMTPVDPLQVVGGLDDTDDEEIIGNENEEPGMLLF